ncbi:MAG: hypothetical protein CMM44_04985 [Rhodospirillaceae bacterium]|nr:hypothetical protein [Rhodospirillaceae bacterium]
MKRISLIILSILLIHTSPVSGGVGDVYYCVQKEVIMLKDFKLTKYKLEKFTLKRTAQGLIFGKGGLFNGTKLQRKIHDDGYELFSWGDGDGASLFNYSKGQFTYTQATFTAAVAIQGTCSVF